MGKTGYIPWNGMKVRPISRKHLEYIVDSYMLTPSPVNGHCFKKEQNLPKIPRVKHLNEYTAEWFGRVMCDYWIAYQW